MNKTKLAITSFSILYSLSLVVTPAYAATTPTPTTDVKLNKQIDQLKDKIASRVSELNLVEKRGVIGVVQSTKSNQITMVDITGQAQLIDVDEITKFTSTPNKANFGISDLTKGTRISVLGLYNKESKRILARFVNTDITPNRISGTITTLDTKNDTFALQTNDGKQLTITIDTATKVTSSSSGATPIRYGFSKLAIGDRVLVVGNPDKTEPKAVLATRIIDFIGAPKNPNVSVSAPTTPTVAATAAPTSAGARGIQPIK